MLGKGINMFYFKTGYQFACFQNFEKNQFSFVGSHKPRNTY
jgi:hypothetical protein